ncbi:MAG TPA: hypothetical protein VGC45_04840 [Gryllotalpicola sp.]
MSVTEAAAPALSPTLRQRARAGRGWLVAAAIIFVTVVIGVLIAGQSAQQLSPLDPSSATPTGAKALVTVLREHGVEVRTAETRADADRAAAGAPAGDLTVAVYDPNRFLDPARLAADDRLDAPTVLIAPPSGARDALRATGRDVAVVSRAAPLENGHILEGNNAGQALRLLGGTRVLLWYTPTLADAGVSAPKTIADLTPPWVTPLVVLGGLTALAAALWQGRRFGPLVVEDLPVVVRASESLDGRARLYQRSDARGHALDALRMGAVGRLASALGLGPSADVVSVCAAASATTRRPFIEVRRVLLDAVPRDDAELMALARELARLEASVRRSMTDVTT